TTDRNAPSKALSLVPEARSASKRKRMLWVPAGMFWREPTSSHRVVVLDACATTGVPMALPPESRKVIWTKAVSPAWLVFQRIRPPKSTTSFESVERFTPAAARLIVWVTNAAASPGATKSAEPVNGAVLDDPVAPCGLVVQPVMPDSNP